MTMRGRASSPTQDPGPSSRHWAAVAVAALAALVYLNALPNGLVWDDPIVLTRQLQAFRSVHDLIFTPRNIPQFSPDYYRPLTTLSYLLDHAIAGNAPFMFHLSVALYHVVATYLVFQVGLLLFTAPLPAAFGAALFAVHPIHSESVAWGAGRSDVLACCFSLLAVLAYRRTAWSAPRRALLAALSVFVAALAKETATSCFVLVPAMDVLLGPLMPLTPPTGAPAPRSQRRRQREQPVTAAPSQALLYLPFVVAFIIYLGLRQAALKTVLGSAQASGVGVLQSMVAAVGVYLGKLLWPLAQCAFISDLPTAPPAVAAILLLVAGIAAATYLAWQRGQRPVTFLLLWITLTLVPSLAIVAKIPAAPIAERYLYLPSVGFCLLVGYGAAWLSERIGRIPVFAAMALLIAAGAFATIERNAVWRSNLSLWADTAAKNTTDGLPARSLGAAYLEQGDHAKALEAFQLALQRRNDMLGQFVIYNNLGSLAMSEQRLDDAEHHYRTALALNPSAPDTLFNLGLIALTRATDKAAGDAAAQHDQALQARQLFEQALRQHPLDTDTLIALGQTLSALGDARGARAQYEHALQLGLSGTTAASVRQLLAELPADAHP